MPIYMDRHYVEGATAHAVAVAHSAELAGQDRYRVRFLTSRVGCLAPATILLMACRGRASPSHR